MSSTRRHPIARVVWTLASLAVATATLVGLGVAGLPTAVAAPTPAATSGTRGLLWQIDGPAGAPPSYLLGSLHLGTPDMYPMAAHVNAAFEKTEVLVLEARPDKTSPELTQSFLTKGLYPEGDSMQKRVAPAVWKAAQAAAARLAVPATVLARMKPWMAALTLGVLGVKAHGFDEKLGVETHFLGKLGTRSVEELEGMVWQIDLFSGFSPSEQEQFLLYTLRGAGSVKQELTAMVRAWKRGNQGELDSVMQKGLRKTPSAKAVYKRLITDRNRTMATRVDELVKNGRPLFVVVGAGHLGGPEGMVALLRQKGYRVSQR